MLKPTQKYFRIFAHRFSTMATIHTGKTKQKYL